MRDIPTHWITLEEVEERLMKTTAPKRYVTTMTTEDRQIVKQVGKIRSNIRGAVNSLDSLVTRVGRETPLGMLAEELRNDLAGPAGNASTLLDLTRELTNAKSKGTPA